MQNFITELEKRFEKWAEDNASILQKVEDMIDEDSVSMDIKARLVAGVALPVVKEMRADEELMGLLKDDLKSSYVMAQQIFEQLPEEEISAFIAQKIPSVPAAMLEPLAMAKIQQIQDKMNNPSEEPEKPKKSKKETTLEALIESKKLTGDYGVFERIRLEGMLEEERKQQKLNKDLEDHFVNNGVSALTEDQYVAFSNAVAQALPLRLRELLVDPLNEGNVEANTRKVHREKKQGTYRNLGTPFLRLTPSTVLAKAFAEVAGKLDGARVQAVMSDVFERVDYDMVEQFVDNTLDFAVALLENVAESGNMTPLKNTAAGYAFAQSVGEITQIVEDAVVDAGLVPDTDIVTPYKQALVEERTRQAAANGSKPLNFK